MDIPQSFLTNFWGTLQSILGGICLGGIVERISEDNIIQDFGFKSTKQ